MTDDFSKNKILFVPGKNPKPLPDAHRALLWRCLLRGVELIDPVVARSLAATPECFSLAAWNSTFYGEIKDIDEDVPWIDGLCQKTGPDRADVHEALSWRNRRIWLLNTLADLLPVLIALAPDPAVKDTIKETERYFSNTDGIATRLREMIKAPLRRSFAAGERVLLIGHSMGSIIAYDALWELTHDESIDGRVDLFLTLGSPLGMRFVQNRILGYRDREPSYPCCIRRWINVAAHGDLWALDPEIRNDYLPMLQNRCVEAIEDLHSGVFGYFRNEEGLNAHRSYGYLVEQHVGRTIAAWWQGDGRADTTRPGGDQG